MRKDFQCILAVCAAAVFATAASAQEDFSKVEIKTEKLSDTVYMMTGSGGNLGVSAGADGVIFSRKYSEMRLANLEAAGRAVREFKA